MNENYVENHDSLNHLFGVERESIPVVDLTKLGINTLNNQTFESITEGVQDVERITLLDKICDLIFHAEESKYEGYEKDLAYLNYLKINYGKILTNERLRNSATVVVDNLSNRILNKNSVKIK